MNRHDNSEARGRLLIWAGVLIFAATGTVMCCLTNLGAEYPIDGRNAITSCAILLVGNICAFLLASALYARTWTPANLARLTRGDWAAMGLSSMLSSAVAPALTLIALETMSVTEVVLIGRIEPLVFLILAMWFLGVALDRWVLAGGTLALAGVGLTLMLQADGLPELGPGQLCAALAAASLVLSTITSKARLQAATRRARGMVSAGMAEATTLARSAGRALIRLKRFGPPPGHRPETARAQEEAARSWQPAHGLVAFAVVPGAPPLC